MLPARGGSKRIPRKNVRDFCGKPMIHWTIATALESGCFDRVVVSTDDREIGDVARAAGAEPFERPASLSGDFTGTTAVMAHAVEWLGAADADLACCIYPTAVLLVASDIRVGLDALLASDADYAFSVAGYDHPVQRAMRRLPDGRVQMLSPETAQVRTQDLEPAVHDAGQFYWGRASAWRGQHSILSGKSIAIEVPRSRAEDIDTPQDWARAEALFLAQRAAG